MFFLILFFCLGLVFVGCSKDDINFDSGLVDYTVELQVITSGYDGHQCWFHPRATSLGNEKDMLILMQPWVSKHPDYYESMHYMRSYDGGMTWSDPVSLERVLGEIKEADGTTIKIADVTPQWHKKSKTVLATGVTVYYRDSTQFRPCPRETCFFVYNPKLDNWSSWQKLKMPDNPNFYHASVGCSQWVDLPSGDILLPISYLEPESNYYKVMVLRCSFDGVNLKYEESGNSISFERGRGLYEPSLIEFRGKYYLTLRNDVNGFVSVSNDGLHYDLLKEWEFDDGSSINSENTQQHWIKSPKALFLVYTSSKRPENLDVFRGRAPLFIAQFDDKNLTLLKETERVLVPNNGAQLGNFGAFTFDKKESWVTTSEGTDDNNVHLGADGRVYLAKVLWN